MADLQKKTDSSAMKVIGLVTFLAAALSFAALVVLPAVFNLIASFQHFNYSKGLFGSPLLDPFYKNYQYLFLDGKYGTHILWSAGYASLSSLMLFLVSLPVGYLLLATGKHAWIRHTLCTLLLLPLVIPQEVWAMAFVKLTAAASEASQRVTGSPIPPTDRFSLMLLASWGALKYLGLPALLVNAAMSGRKSKWAVPPLAAGITALVFLALFGRADAAYLLQFRIPIIPGSGGIDAFVFIATYNMGQVALGSAAQVAGDVLRFVLMAIVAVPVALMAWRLFRDRKEPSEANLKQRLVSLILPGAVILAAAVLLGVAASKAGGVEFTKQTANMVICGVLAIAGSLLNTVMCVLLARPLVVGSKWGKIAAGAVLAVLTAMSMSPISFGQYSLIRAIGAYNTHFSVFIVNIISVWGAWALALAGKSRGISTSTDWFKTMWKPAIALFAIQAVFMAGNTLPAIQFISKPEMFTPLMVLRQLTLSNNGFVDIMQGALLNPDVVNGVHAMLALMVSAVPALVLLAVRTVFNDRDNAALFLPGK